MSDKNKMIEKILNNTYIDLKDVELSFLEEFKILFKLKKLGIDVGKFEKIVSDNKIRLSHFKEDTKYDMYVILNNELRYYIVDEFGELKTLLEVQKKYNKIDFQLIDNLLLYKEDKLDIQQIAEYIQTMK